MPRSKTTLIDPDVALLQAIGHPTRLAILRELAGCAEVCACDFTMCCDVQQPTISHHLKVLKEAGVVDAERRGTSIFYRLRPEAAARLRVLAGELTPGAGEQPLIQVSTLARRSSAAQPTVS